MATLTCKGGTVIQISAETEAELRKAFEPKPPEYENGILKIYVRKNSTTWPIGISIGCREKITRTVVVAEEIIVFLQEAVEYCKQHNLG